jgi:hypothetical protein
MTNRETSVVKAADMPELSIKKGDKTFLLYPALNGTEK